MILSEDEDDYWGSFKGTASWQRKAAEDSVREETRTEAGAGAVLGVKAKAVQKEYSWGGGSAPHSSLSMRHPPPGTSSGEECVVRMHDRVTESSIAISRGVEVRWMSDTGVEVSDAGECTPVSTPGRSKGV